MHADDGAYVFCICTLYEEKARSCESTKLQLTKAALGQLQFGRPK